MKPRVVLLNPIGGIGGAERILLAVARHLHEHRQGWSVSAILFGDGPLNAALSKYGVDVRILPLPENAAALGDTALRGRSKLGRITAMATSGLLNGPGLLSHTRRLRSLLNALQPNLVHSNGLKSHLFSSLALHQGVPLLWHIHDFYSHRPLMANVLKRLTGRAALAIAISKSVQADTAIALPGLASSLVYNGVDTARFAPGTANGERLDALAGFAPAQSLRVGLVATYANWKGHDVFLKAIALLKHTAARFYIIGGPIYSTLGSQFTLEELKSLAASLGIADRVGFVPFQADPAEVYRSLDVVVHASTRPEPFGLTIAEAMACGRPAVVAVAGGASELFANGVDAIGHEPGIAPSLAAAINSLLSDAALRQRIGEAARVTAATRFSEERMGAEIASLYSRYLPDQQPQ